MLGGRHYYGLIPDVQRRPCGGEPRGTVWQNAFRTHPSFPMLRSSGELRVETTLKKWKFDASQTTLGSLLLGSGQRFGGSFTEGRTPIRLFQALIRFQSPCDSVDSRPSLSLRLRNYGLEVCPMTIAPSSEQFSFSLP